MPRVVSPSPSAGALCSGDRPRRSWRIIELDDNCHQSRVFPPMSHSARGTRTVPSPRRGPVQLVDVERSHNDRSPPVAPFSSWVSSGAITPSWSSSARETRALPRRQLPSEPRQCSWDSSGPTFHSRRYPIQLVGLVPSPAVVQFNSWTSSGPATVQFRSWDSSGPTARVLVEMNRLERAGATLRLIRPGEI